MLLISNAIYLKNRRLERSDYMDNKALYKLSYGVFLLSAVSKGKANGCITNTCMQVANSPTRVAISVINTNYTCDLIKSSGVFSLSVLDETCKFETIERFGFKSGRDVDKFEGMTLPVDLNNIPYLDVQTCAVISCKITDKIDLGSHTLFIAEVQDAKRLNDNAPLTYADYQSRVKPKPQVPKQDKKIVGWRCKICGYVYEGSNIPEDFVCPWCGHSRDDFEPIYEEEKVIN